MGVTTARHWVIVSLILGFHALVVTLVVNKYSVLSNSSAWSARKTRSSSESAPPPARWKRSGSAAAADAAASSHGSSNSTHNSLTSHEIHAPEIFYVFFTLIVGALIKYGLKLIKHTFVVPYAVVVLLLGCIYALCAWAERVNGGNAGSPLATFCSIAATDPNVLIMAFLPGLIYEAAFHMQTHLFKKLLVHMVIIGTVGLLLNITLVGVMSKQIVYSNTTNWNMNISFWFSAIVSATDPLAVVALLDEAGTAKTLMVVLEGTSLLSDTSAVVLSNLMEQIVTSPKTDIGTEVQNFFAAVLGGPAWGLLIGFIVTNLLSRMNSVWEAELILIISVPYLTFWSADAGFDIQLSGALATMTVGLWMSSHRTSISPDVEELVNKIWELVSLISNTLIFSIVGMILIKTATEQPVEPGDWFDLFVMNIMILLIRGSVYVLLKPILCRIGIGEKVFTWPHIFVLIWSGFRGAVTLALGMQAAHHNYFTRKPRVAQLLVFHAAGAVAFTLLFNAITMRFFLRRLGVLEIPLSKMITMHMAIKQILLTRHQKLDALKTDRYLADADWQRVDELTGIDGKRYGISDEGDNSLWTMHFVTREIGCPNCEAEVQLEPLPSELDEMQTIARLRLVNAKKTSYWRQYEEGTLSQSGVKHLDDLTDTALNSETGVIDADDVKNVLSDEQWSGLKQKISDLNHWIDVKKSEILEAPPQHWRYCFFALVTSAAFAVVVNIMIFLNLGETVTGWILIPPNQDNVTASAKELHEIFFITNCVFTVFYTMEAMFKLLGLGWAVYWGVSWFTWNRLDLALLALTYAELIMDIVVLYGDTSTVKRQVLPTSALRTLRFFRLVRFGRALRLLRPVLPSLLKFMDSRINAHLFLAYDVAKAFIVAQEECVMMIPNVVGYKPLASRFKTQADMDCRAVVKEVGLLNEKRPDVAAAVKTRQAIRSILNHLKKSVLHMRSQGILDEDEVEHLQKTIEERLKRLHHFPHSISLVKPLERLWSVTWVNGSNEVYDVLKLLFEERKYETAAQFVSAKEEADGVFVIVSGVVSLTYPRAFSDNPELGEVYNSDNLRLTTEEGHEGWNKHDYLLAGGILNEQSVALDFPRRSHGIADTAVTALYLDSETLFRAMAALPSLEARFWKKTATCVALNIIIKMGNSKDSTLETEKSRLARGAVRLIHPGSRVIGLDEFDEAFIITGMLTDLTSSHHDSIIGPRKIPSAVREVEVRQGRRAVTSKNGDMIYPEYAIFLLIPPNGRDISGFNLHDSQANLLERPATNPVKLRNMLYATLSAKQGSPPTEGQLMQLMQSVNNPASKLSRKSTMSPSAALSGKTRRSTFVNNSETRLGRSSVIGRRSEAVGIGLVPERRKSNAAGLIAYAHSRKTETARVIYNVIGNPTDAMDISVAPLTVPAVRTTITVTAPPENEPSVVLAPAAPHREGLLDPSSAENPRPL